MENHNCPLGMTVNKRYLTTVMKENFVIYNDKTMSLHVLHDMFMVTSISFLERGYSKLMNFCVSNGCTSSIGRFREFEERARGFCFTGRR